MEILKLREARDKAGLDQHQVGKLIQRHATEISTYENGRAVPPVEDIVKLEQALGARLDWNEPEEDEQRMQFIANMNCLCKRYPLQAVLALATKSLKEDNPGSLLTTYCATTRKFDQILANKANESGSGGPLYPGGQEIIDK